ncbi:MAG TPA: phospholipase D-like domain-containing protein [Flavobacteriales bacterium]|nr:phospholipase D-like domain-containing protein [Flavobacteriales bacterium]HRO40189.1 phospholipase D-like domain-containing protein [Flavobacteriales bacterium]
MKRCAFFVFAAGMLLTAPALYAQSIATARAASLGSTVTVTGVVTSGASLGPIRYLQDASAGIAAYPGSGSVPGFNPQPGDQVTLSGTLTSFNGLLEITPISSFTVNSTGNMLPDAVVVEPAGMNDQLESELVRMEGVYFTASGVFTAGERTVQAGTQTGTVYLRSGHPLIGTPVPAGPVDITGIVSQYSITPPYNDGYQLLPRSGADIAVHNAISILPPVVQGNLVGDGFTLTWQTNLAGSTEAFFGTTPAMGSHTASGTVSDAHELQFTGLQPATFYYAQAFSVDNGDTAFAVPGLYSTASSSSGSIKVYFTKSVDTSVGSGQDAIGLFDATDDTIKAYIDRAEQTLDIAIYNTNSNLLAHAVNMAVDRGVQVRWIAEGANANTALANLYPSIPVLYRTNTPGSMHNKFMIIDADDPQRATVMSGSCNWTTQSFFDDYNNILFIQDQALARCYRVEFEEMWGGNGAQPVPSLSRFGPGKEDNTPHLFNIGGVEVESIFSPSDGTTARIKKVLDDAQEDLRLALYIFTENSLGDAVLDAKGRPGMLVAGDVEDIDATGSEFNYLVGQGVELLSHADEPGLLHHKYAIVDAGVANGARVVTGSHNWTAGAESSSDENTLVIHDAAVANLFLQEWTARHQAVMGAREQTAKDGMRLWPVPAVATIHCAAPFPITYIRIIDMVGREVVSVAGPMATEATIDTRVLEPGGYLVRLEGGGRSAIACMVKE